LWVEFASIQAFKIMSSDLVCGDDLKMSENSPPGERKIIDLIVRKLHKMPHMPIPFGDDISGMDIGAGRIAVLKSDMLVARTDIPRGMGLRQAARKAVVMNVSDFASKGVQPRAVMVSLGLPRSTTVSDVEEIAAGLDEASREYGAYVIGGDTNECDDLVIACYLFGTAERKRVVERSGAKPGDLVAVTGEFGNTIAGLKLLETETEIPQQVRTALLASVYDPKARLKEGIALARARALTASMDSSDGLAWSLHEISRASSVGMELHDVPVSAATLEYSRVSGVDPLDLALYGGEEFELVVCLKKNAAKRALRSVRSLHIIGSVTKDAGTVTLVRDGTRTAIEPRGWEHLSSNPPRS
jgi:thiamine-monophosphate kinase